MFRTTSNNRKSSSSSSSEKNQKSLTAWTSSTNISNNRKIKSFSLTVFNPAQIPTTRLFINNNNVITNNRNESTPKQTITIRKKPIIIIAVILIQAWWRCKATRKRYLCLYQNTFPWRDCLQPTNEGVAYGSICTKASRQQSNNFDNLKTWNQLSSSTKIFFLILTTKGRLLCCDPVTRQILEETRLSHGETTSCDLGNQTFSVSSVPNSKGCYFVHTFIDLLTTSLVWVTVLRELPSVQDLNRVCRRNSMRASNFPIRQMGIMSLETNSLISSKFGIHETYFVILHGSKLIMFKPSSLKCDFIDIDHFSVIYKDDRNPNKFILQTINGGCFKWYCKDENLFNEWITQIQFIIDRLMIGFMRLGRRKG